MGALKEMWDRLGSALQVCLLIDATGCVFICIGCFPPLSYGGDREMCSSVNRPDTDEVWWVPEGAFVRTQAPTIEPPTVRAYVEVGSEERFVDGIRYIADWLLKHNRLTQRPVVPVPWPEPTPGKPCSIRIISDFLPVDVSIIGYGDVDPITGEPPSMNVDTRYECSRYGPESCTYPHPDGYIEIVGVPQDIMDQPYLIIFVVWPVHPDAVGDQPGDPSTLAASWLFQFTQR